MGSTNESGVFYQMMREWRLIVILYNFLSICSIVHHHHKMISLFSQLDACRRSYDVDIAEFSLKSRADVVDGIKFL